MDGSEHDPAEYGRSFAEVYDTWYPGGDEADVVEFLRAELPDGARILELGVGTGRVALPLAAAGFAVTGLDSSAEMLGVLAAKDPHDEVDRILADAGDPASWPADLSDSRFDCVLAACNLLLNLTAPGAQHTCLTAASELLELDGLMVTELSRLSLPPARSSDHTTSSAAVDADVSVSTEWDPETRIVRGRHEHAKGSERVRRSWKVRALDDSDVGRWCEELGLVVDSRHGTWSRRPCREDDAVTITTYRRVGRGRAGQGHLGTPS